MWTGSSDFVDFLREQEAKPFTSNFAEPYSANALPSLNRSEKQNSFVSYFRVQDCEAPFPTQALPPIKRFHPKVIWSTSDAMAEKKMKSESNNEDISTYEGQDYKESLGSIGKHVLNLGGNNGAFKKLNYQLEKRQPSHLIKLDEGLQCKFGLNE